MWDWMLHTYEALIIFAGAGALLVALLVPENQQDRRRTAFRIFKLVLGAGTSVAAMATIAIRLTGTGLF
jgi:hypothetical protein